jgi:hypothetical protein
MFGFLCGVITAAGSHFFFKLHWYNCQYHLMCCFTRLKILIEVDHLQGLTTPYLQIKGTNKEIVSSAGSALSLDSSYTTKVCLRPNQSVWSIGM